jgi:hypothetical protein
MWPQAPLIVGEIAGGGLSKRQPSGVVRERGGVAVGMVEQE